MFHFVRRAVGRRDRVDAPDRGHGGQRAARGLERRARVSGPRRRRRSRGRARPRDHDDGNAGRGGDHEASRRSVRLRRAGVLRLSVGTRLWRHGRGRIAGGPSGPSGLRATVACPHDDRALCSSALPRRRRPRAAPRCDSALAQAGRRARPRAGARRRGRPPRGSRPERCSSTRARRRRRARASVRPRQATRTRRAAPETSTLAQGTARDARSRRSRQSLERRRLRSRSSTGPASTPTVRAAAARSAVLSERTGALPDAHSGRPRHGRAALGGDRSSERRGVRRDDAALRLRRQAPRDGRRPPRAPTSSCACRAASRSSSTPRCRSRPTSRRTRRPTRSAGGARRPRAPGTRPRRGARRKAYWQQFDADARTSSSCSFPTRRTSAPPRNRTRSCSSFAYERGVLLATPRTSSSLLRTIRIGWQNENASRARRCRPRARARAARAADHDGRALCQARARPRFGRQRVQPGRRLLRLSRARTGATPRGPSSRQDRHWTPSSRCTEHASSEHQPLQLGSRPTER